MRRSSVCGCAPLPLVRQCDNCMRDAACDAGLCTAGVRAAEMRSDTLREGTRAGCCAKAIFGFALQEMLYATSRVICRSTLLLSLRTGVLVIALVCRLFICAHLI